MNEPLDYISTLSILYVEDEESIRSSLGRMLKRRTETLHMAENGVEALRLFKEIKPDLVITDIHMPMMDGLTMIQHIREIDPAVPIIITTGHNDEQIFMRSLELGVDKFVKKPVDTKVLMAGIAKISHEVMQRRELREKNELIINLMDINPFYLAVFGEKGLQYLNHSFMKLLDVCSVQEFREKYNSFIGMIVDKDLELTDDSLMGAWAFERAGGDNSDLMFRMKLPNREKPYSFMLNAAQISSKNKDFLLTIADVTQLEKEKQRLQFLADYDALTKVYNRRKINKELDGEVVRAVRYGQSLSVIIMDIDHFKKINDNYGHLVGDVVLVEFAELVQSKIRQTDLFGRYGGEEFTLIMPSTSLDGATEIANRLIQYISSFSFSTVGHVTCSMGVAEYIPQENAPAFVKRADDALYAAKRNGRNRAEMADKSSVIMSCE